ncbi:hypothetical protein PMIN03_002597 [Paraphaeosphaeria minitans]
MMPRWGSPLEAIFFSWFFLPYWRQEQRSQTPALDTFDAMHLFFALAALLTFAPATATQDLCPKDEYACLDIINASQCLAQLVIQKMSPLTKENIIKCVETEGVASNLPGAQKVR